MSSGLRNIVCRSHQVVALFGIHLKPITVEYLRLSSRGAKRSEVPSDVLDGLPLDIGLPSFEAAPQEVCEWYIRLTSRWGVC